MHRVMEFFKVDLGPYLAINLIPNVLAGGWDLVHSEWELLHRV